MYYNNYCSSIGFHFRRDLYWSQFFGPHYTSSSNLVSTTCNEVPIYMKYERPTKIPVIDETIMPSLSNPIR